MSDYKRDHPRIKQSLQVEIIASQEKTLFATTCDVSKRGVQLLCDSITVQDIFDGPAIALPIKPPVVILKLTLKTPGQEALHIEAECKAVFSRRISEQEYRVGLSIHSLPRASRIALDAYVDEYL
jgi:hypothetical protein